MSKLMKLLVVAGLSVSSLAFAQQVTLTTITALNPAGQLSLSLDPSVGGSRLAVPLTVFGGKVPADLSIQVPAGQLPAGHGLVLREVTSDTTHAYLLVEYTGYTAGEFMYAMPDILLMSGGQTVGRVWLPVHPAHPVHSGE